MRIQFLDETKKSLVPVFTIELTDAIFTSFQFAGGGSGLEESLTLNFSKITLKHNASGTTATWDVEQNKQ